MVFGFTTRGMNIAVRAKTEQEACINALLYYQKRLKEVESDLESLDSKVQDFLAKLGIELNKTYYYERKRIKQGH